MASQINGTASSGAAVNAVSATERAVKKKWSDQKVEVKRKLAYHLPECVFAT